MWLRHISLDSAPSLPSEPHVETYGEGNTVHLFYIGQSGYQQRLIRVRASGE